MIGLRRLAETIFEDNRAVNVEIPIICEAYIDSTCLGWLVLYISRLTFFRIIDIHSRYLAFPLPPLITNPHASAQLSSAALKRNLEAHAVCNPSILATGTRPEMVQRLSEILKIRKLDMLVKDMLSGNDSGFEKL